MKRLLSVFLCMGLLFTLCSVGVTADIVNSPAEENLFERFADEASFLRLFDGFAAEGENYSPHVVTAYTHMTGDFSLYGKGEYYGYDTYEYYEVPASVYEHEVGRFFQLNDRLIASLRAYEGGLWDEETGVCAPLYDKATDCYVFPGGGGLGDSGRFRTYAYYKDEAVENRYVVYFQLLEPGYVPAAEDVLYEDYLFDGSVESITCYEIIQPAKFVMEYDGRDVKFIYSEWIDSLPDRTDWQVQPLPEVVVDGDFAFTLVNERTALWLGAYTGTADSVTVPEEVNGLPVIGIAEYAFAYREELKKVSLPEGLLTINNSAFAWCSALEEVTLPTTVYYIGDEAFRGTSLTSVALPVELYILGAWVFSDCANLATIAVAAGNKEYVVEDGVLFNADKTHLIRYPAAKSGTTYTVPSSVANIWPGAFYGAAALTEVVFPDNLALIGDEAFAYSGLVAADLPDGIYGLGDGAFANCQQLQEVTLPAGIDTLRPMLFYGTGLTNVVIPHGVQFIHESAFGDCSALETVTLPATLQDIFPYAFWGSSPKFIYLGTEQDWSNVSHSLEEPLDLVFAPTLKAEDTAVRVTYSDGSAFPEDMTLSVQPVTDAAVLEKVKDYPGAQVLDITLQQNGDEIQPDGQVTVRVPVPEGMMAEICCVLRVEEDGTLTDMNALLVGDMLVFTTDHFSYYAVAQSVRLGDVDWDGDITSTDARLTLQYYAGKIEEEDLDVTAADVDGDGDITSTDARLILQYYAGKITEWP